MAVSGTTTVELNRDEIISASMRKCGALAKGQSPDAEDLTNYGQALNNLVAEFMTMGMPLWAERTYAVPLVLAQDTYTLSAPFPLRIIEAWFEATPNSSKIIMEETADYDINRLPGGASGIPIQYSYQPQINSGTLTVWPSPDALAITGTMNIRYVATFDQFISAANTPFFPREWNNALIYGLSSLISPEIGVPLNDRGMLEKSAAHHLDIALDAGDEYSSLLAQPDNGI